MKIATFNVNSIRMRLPAVTEWLARHQPDVLCLQETKVPDAAFPLEPLARLGYRHALVHGMKGYNGVAILSRRPFRARETKGWCGRADCRHAIVRLDGGIELHDVYVPSGGDVPDPQRNDKFAHKLQFLDELTAWFAARGQAREKLILVGDLNVAPLEADVWSHKQLLSVVSHTPVEVARFERLQASRGWIDAVRRFIPPPQRLYSWWSYRARDWAASDRGRRIDHVWVTPALAPGLRAAQVVREARGWDAPSDHVPVVVDLD